jgi:hypothetical protein
MPEPEDLHPPFVRRDSALQAAQEGMLIAALRDIEWGGMMGRGHCPACGALKKHGHMSACMVGLALTPDHGAAQLNQAVTDALRDIGTRRRSIQVVVGACSSELDDLEDCLTTIQDLLHLF